MNKKYTNYHNPYYLIANKEKIEKFLKEYYLADTYNFKEEQRHSSSTHRTTVH